MKSSMKGKGKIKWHRKEARVRPYPEGTRDACGQRERGEKER